MSNAPSTPSWQKRNGRFNTSVSDTNPTTIEETPETSTKELSKADPATKYPSGPPKVPAVTNPTTNARQQTAGLHPSLKAKADNVDGRTATADHKASVVTARANLREKSLPAFMG